MTARELFDALAPLVAPAVQEVFNRRDLCIFATRVAIEVSAYFGILAEPLPVKVILYNATFAAHVANNFAGVERSNPAAWGDGSWSVGIGYGAPKRFNGWDGHLIAVADDCFADFSIQQAERVEHDIITGPGLVGPYVGSKMWQAVSETTGTVIDYMRTDDDSWRNAPDWKDAKRRKPVVGALIRALKAAA
jgi:hypothetical protein